MIHSFRDRDTECVYGRHPVRRMSPDLQRRARVKLLLIDNAGSLNDLRIPPGNRLESLVGDRHGQHSIRVNDQWRICFRWDGGDAWDVEITDYH